MQITHAVLHRYSCSLNVHMWQHCNRIHLFLWDYEGVILSTVQFIKAAFYQARLWIKVVCPLQEEPGSAVIWSCAAEDTRFLLSVRQRPGSQSIAKSFGTKVFAVTSC